MRELGLLDPGFPKEKNLNDYQTQASQVGFSNMSEIVLLEEDSFSKAIKSNDIPTESTHSEGLKKS